MCYDSVMTTSQEDRIANRKRVLDVIESVTTDSSVKRPDLAKAVLDVLEDAELLAPYGAFEVVVDGTTRAAVRFEDAPDGVRIGYNGDTPMTYQFSAGAEVREL